MIPHLRRIALTCVALGLVAGLPAFAAPPKAPLDLVHLRQATERMNLQVPAARQVRQVYVLGWEQQLLDLQRRVQQRLVNAPAVVGSVTR